MTGAGEPKQFPPFDQLRSRCVQLWFGEPLNEHRNRQQRSNSIYDWCVCVTQVRKTRSMRKIFSSSNIKWNIHLIMERFCNQHPFSFRTFAILRISIWCDAGKVWNYRQFGVGSGGRRRMERGVLLNSFNSYGNDVECCYRHGDQLRLYSSLEIYLIGHDSS